MMLPSLVGSASSGILRPVMVSAHTMSAPQLWHFCFIPHPPARHLLGTRLRPALGPSHPTCHGTASVSSYRTTTLGPSASACLARDPSSGRNGSPPLASSHSLPAQAGR